MSTQPVVQLHAAPRTYQQGIESPPILKTISSSEVHCSTVSGQATHMAALGAQNFVALWRARHPDVCSVAGIKTIFHSRIHWMESVHCHVRQHHSSEQLLKHVERLG